MFISLGLEAPGISPMRLPSHPSMMIIAMDVEPMFPYTNPAQAILSGMAQIGTARWKMQLSFREQLIYWL